MLTPAQIEVLRLAIIAETDAEFLRDMALGNVGEMADFFNSESSFIVYRTDVPVIEIVSNGIVWTEIDALTAGKARIWQWMTQFGSINPSKQNIRNGIRDCFQSAAPNTFAAIQQHLRRPATRFEKLLATGAGTSASPGLLTFEGNIDFRDIIAAGGQIGVT